MWRKTTPRDGSAVHCESAHESLVHTESGWSVVQFDFGGTWTAFDNQHRGARVGSGGPFESRVEAMTAVENAWDKLTDAQQLVWRVPLPL